MISIGTVYNGKIPELFDDWIQSLCNDISFLQQKPELIIINKSNITIDTNSFSDKFSNVKIIKIGTNYNPTLLDCYKKIINISSFDIIHFRNECIIPPSNGLEFMYNFLTSGNSNMISGIYKNSQSNISNIIIQNDGSQSENNKSDNTFDIEYFKKSNLYNAYNSFKTSACGLEFSIFKKYKIVLTNTFSYRNKTLDIRNWLLSQNTIATNCDIIVMPEVNCKFYIDKDRYILFDENYDNIKSLNFLDILKDNKKLNISSSMNILDKKDISKNNLSKNNKKNKIAICIPFYQRYEITDFVFNYYNKLIEELKNDIDIMVITAGSEGLKSRQLAEKYNFIYSEFPNSPLSQKHNSLYLKAKEYNPDACIKIDSDNIITKEFFYFYDSLINENYDYGGILDCFFVLKKDVIHFKGYIEQSRLNEPMGTGRFLSKQLLDTLEWMPWSNLKINKILDKNLTKILKSRSYQIKSNVIRCQDIGGYNIDIKSKFQITNVYDFKNNNIEIVNLYNKFNSMFNLNSIESQLLEYDKSKLSQNELLKYDKSQFSENQLFSIVIPTQWNLKNIGDFENFLIACDNSKYVGEIILIDNDNKNIKIDLKQFKKINHIINDENIYVNPSWNLGYALHNKDYKLILANDDLKINDNIDIIFELLNSTNYEIVGLQYNNNIKISKIENINEFPRNNYGSFMYVKDFKYIPEQFKIWIGDNFQFNNANIDKRGILKTNLIQNIECRINKSKSIYSIALLDYKEYERFNSHDDTKLNIIIRTSNRPNYFKNCVDSIKKLYTPEEIKFHITIDDYKDLCYVMKNLSGYDYNYYFIDRDKVEKICKAIKIIKPLRLENYYLNIVKPFLNGWCQIIDDDDKMIEKININNFDCDNIYLYKTIINNRIIPSNKNFKNNIVLGDISGLCIIFHSSQMIDWTPQNGGDYYFISELYKKYNCIWLDKIIAQSQDRNHMGNRKDLTS